MSLNSFISLDRRIALHKREALPDWNEGSLLFADLSGFTTLTQTLIKEFGPRRGPEELTLFLNALFTHLIRHAHMQGGSITGFAGDAITCWFKDDDGHRALSAAFAMMTTLEEGDYFKTWEKPAPSLTMKIGIASGKVFRYVVGAPEVQLIDVTAGEPMFQLAIAEKVAESGEIVICSRTYHQVREKVDCNRVIETAGGLFYGISRLRYSIRHTQLPVVHLPEDEARAWVMPDLREFFIKGTERFLSELRLAIPLFLQFQGIDFISDQFAGSKLDTFIRSVQKQVQTYAGNLLQVIIGEKGNYLYLLFGAPRSTDNDVDRAIECAHALVRLQAECSFITSIRIGMARGNLCCGAYGSTERKTYSALGASANLAARLMSGASANEIRVDQTICKTSRNWSFKELPPTVVKGLREKIVPYIPEKRNRDRLIHTVSTVLIGRSLENAQLAAGIQSLSEGVSSLLLLHGEAGIGKSSLVMTFMDAAERFGVHPLIGFAQSMESTTPYYVWRELLFQLCRLDGRMSEEQRQNAISDFISTYLAEHTERLPLLNDILNLDFPESELTIQLSDKLRQVNLFILVTAMCAAFAQSNSLVMICEDTHWLDNSSWELLLHVTRNLEHHDIPFLCLLTRRPVSKHNPVKRYIDQVESFGLSQNVLIGPLSEENIRALICYKLEVSEENVPGPLFDTIKNKAEGNPFFAEELLNSLLEEGVIQIADDKAKRVVSLGVDLTLLQHEIPDTIHGIILARMDRLPAELLLTLKVASVVGRSFSIHLVKDVMNEYELITEAELKQYLIRLNEENFTTTIQKENEQSYMFKHNITQTAAYSTMLFDQRRELHKCICQWYEFRSNHHHPDEFRPGETLIPSKDVQHYPLLAYHCRFAEMPEAEKYYSYLSAKVAASQYAHTEAISYYNRIIELTGGEDLEGLSILCAERAERYNSLGKRVEQKKDLERVLDIAIRMDDAQKHRSALLRLGTYYACTGEYSLCQSICDELGAQISADPDEKQEGAFYYVQGILYFGQGYYERSEIWLKRALTIYRSLNSISEIIHIIDMLSLTALWLGDEMTARQFVEEGLTLSLQSENLIAIAISYSTYGKMLTFAQKNKEAQSYFEKAIAMSNRIGERSSEAICTSNLALSYLNLADYQKSLDLNFRALKLSREAGLKETESIILLNIGSVLLETDTYEKSKSYLEEAIQLNEEMNNLHTIAQCKALLGNLKILWVREDYGESDLRFAISILMKVKDGTLTCYAFSQLLCTLIEKRKYHEAEDVITSIIAHHESKIVPVGMRMVAIICKMYLGLTQSRMPQVADLESLGLLNYLSENFDRDAEVYYFPMMWLNWYCYKVLSGANHEGAHHRRDLAFELYEERLSRFSQPEIAQTWLTCLSPALQEIKRTIER